jgi:hypothetical protein
VHSLGPLGNGDGPCRDDVYFCTEAMALSFCTLAIHAFYRERARLLCADLAPWPVIVLTDEPSDFADLCVQTIRHTPTGPMAVDYLERLPATGNGRGAAAYHDKRFAIQAALSDFETTIFLDADTRILGEVSPLSGFPSGLAITTVVRKTVAQHLETSGSWRFPAFERLAHELLSDLDALHVAKWCHESCFAVTKNGQEDRFFWAWGYAAEEFRQQGVYSGEGGIIGLAALAAGWAVNYESLAPFAANIQHEGGGPKAAFSK